MYISAERLPLPLKTPFKIAHGTSTIRHNLLARIGEGIGEGALPPYYGFDQQVCLDYVLSLARVLPNSLEPEALERTLASLPAGPSPARCAADLALHDHWGKSLGHPLYALWGLDPADAPQSSLTLSIPDNAEALKESIMAAEGWPILKLKLGAGSPDADLRIVEVAREATSVPLCVDANGAWTLEEAATVIPKLDELGLLFIEQPIRDKDPDAWHALRQRVRGISTPIFADESVQTSSDVMPLQGAVDGINIKLMKAGGLREARRMIELARALNLSVMLGCMIESSVATTAAAHLAPLVDFADLDGSVSLRRDPFSGVKLDCGRLVLPSGSGLGVRAADGM